MVVRRRHGHDTPVACCGRTNAVGLIGRGRADSTAARWRDLVVVAVKARVHGYRLVGVLELPAAAAPGASSRGRTPTPEGGTLERMSELVYRTGARTVLTLGPVDCPALENVLAWSGLRARPVERW